MKLDIVCFEDPLVSRLTPITLARPAYAISCASYRLVDYLRLLGGTLWGSVRPHLRRLQSLDHAIEEFATADLEAEQPLLLVNARVEPTDANLAALRELVSGSHDVVVRDPDDASILAALIRDRKTLLREPLPEVGQQVSALGALLPLLDEGPARPALELSAFHWPHDVVATHMRIMNEALDRRIASGRYREIRDGVFVGTDVRIGDYPVVDVTEGPVVLDDGVRVGPFCFLAGPVYAGPKSRIIEHAALKDAVALGHTVKLGGEVEASIIEAYTNKQHHGFLGHSYLGSWINLGAGTCNSDLKNTYGTINIEYGEHRSATGMQFLGCFMGDYSKTAINTSIFTGKVIGVCSMMYGFVTANVPSYVNYARLFGQTSLLPPDVMINTQARMFARRRVEQRESDRQLIRDMYQLTYDERAADPDLL